MEASHLPRELEQFPPITLDYEPEKFANYFIEKHPVEYQKSLELLQKFENLSEVEAEKRLNLLLAKITIIQRHLIVNGIQTDEQLYESLKNFNDSQGPLFESPADVYEFCYKLRPVIMHVRNSRSFRNSSAGFRRFIQHLRVLLENGEDINDITINDKLEEFENSLQFPEEMKDSEKIFKKNEAKMMLDYTFSIGYQVAGMVCVNMDDGKIALADTEEIHLSLHLPIFEFSIDENHQFLADTSRFLRGKASFVEYIPQWDTVIGEIITPSCLSGVRVRIRGTTFVDEDGQFEPQMWEKLWYLIFTFGGVASPSNKSAQIDVCEFMKSENPTTQTYATPKQFLIEVLLNDESGTPQKKYIRPSFSTLANMEAQMIVHKKKPEWSLYSVKPDQKGQTEKVKEDLNEFDFDNLE